MKYKFHIDRQVKIWHREIHQIESDSYDNACKEAIKISQQWDSDSKSSCLSAQFLEDTADFGFSFGEELNYTNKIEVICNAHGDTIFEK